MSNQHINGSQSLGTTIRFYDIMKLAPHLTPYAARSSIRQNLKLQKMINNPRIRQLIIRRKIGYLHPDIILQQLCCNFDLPKSFNLSIFKFYKTLLMTKRKDNRKNLVYTMQMVHENCISCFFLLKI